jgi:hypothetical protein
MKAVLRLDGGYPSSGYDGHGQKEDGVNNTGLQWGSPLSTPSVQAPG